MPSAVSKVKKHSVSLADGHGTRGDYYERIPNLIRTRDTIEDDRGYDSMKTYRRYERSN